MIKESQINMQKTIEDFLSFHKITFEAEKIFGKQRKHIPYIPDIYLPDGGEFNGMNIPAKTCIELKLRILPTTITSTYNRFQVLKKKEGLSELYLIYDKINETPNFKEKIKEEFKDLILISFTDFIGNFSQSAYNNWIDKRDNNYIPLLIRNIKTNNATLFLGAGVGLSANLPSWNELLKKIFKESSFTNLYDSDIDKIIEACHNSNLIAARYLTQKGFNGKRLEEVVHTIFYKKSVPKYSDLMKSIVGLTQKQQVKSIITYNFDNLIDQKIPNARPIFGNRRVSNASEFPIYHVHGYIPQQNMPLDMDIVLSEETYHEKYREVYDWSNVEQLYALTHSTCLFIGLSMSDPNLRRLLDFAKSKYLSDEQDCPHYAFLQRSSLNGCNMPCGNNKNMEHIELQERIFRDMGITIIWYEEHNDLPSLIDTISASL